MFLLQNLTCRYLVALCHFEVGEYPSALNILEHNDNNNVSPSKVEGEPLSVPEIDDVMSVSHVVILALEESGVFMYYILRRI